MAPKTRNQPSVSTLVFVLLSVTCTEVMGGTQFAKDSVAEERRFERGRQEKVFSAASFNTHYSSAHSAPQASSVHEDSSDHGAKETYMGGSSNRASVAVIRESQKTHMSSAPDSSQSSSHRSHSRGPNHADQSSHRLHRPSADPARRLQDKAAARRAESQHDGKPSAEVGSSNGSLALASAGSASGEIAARRDRTGRQHSSASRDMSELDRVSALSSDKEQRSYYQRLFSQRCTDCEVNGQTYKGHTRFEYTKDCQRFRCICRCDGTPTCPPKYTMTVCQEGQEEGGGQAVARDRYMGDLRRRRCKTCEVLGQQFEGNSYFDYKDGCTRFRGCICYCNGTWVCPTERAIDVCQPTTRAPACRACNAKGKVVSANSLFELEEPCWRYRYCRCHCNGSWDCPQRFAENTCQSPTANPQENTHPGCSECSTPNKQKIPGNTYFQMTLGCKEYKNCVCRCNGSWSCPDKYSRDTCKDSASAEGHRRGRHLPPTSSECQSCLAYGRYFRGNTYFGTRQGCTSYERCVCRCDGSWDCPSRFVTDLCRDDDPTNDVDNPNDTCSFCDAEGKIVPPNSFFNMSKRCVQYSQCLCHCDGAWSCPKRFSRNTCERPTQPRTLEPERDCSSCHVNSRVVRGNSYFDFTSACFRYRDCLCKCDGTYHCEEERAINICNYTTTAGASPPSSSLQMITPPPSCVRCLAFGQLHDWDTDFVHEEDCVEYECHCHCNGSYTCPVERARRTCQPGCKECEVGGQFFEGNTFFQHTRGCVVYLCTCYCNGSYFCPAERANYTCPGEDSAPPITPLSDITALQGLEELGQCQQCVTNDGVAHEPGQDFELQEGCIHYRCHCHCDGSWNCPGQDARNTCRGEVLGGCRSCVLSESQIYRGGKEFAMRQGCTHYQCRCNCDGSWDCPGDLARDICLGEVPGGCRVCRVSNKEMYRGGSTFPLRQGCLHYQCQCHCNGSWECPGDTVRDVCIGEVPGGCRVCRLDSGKIYRGESNFQMVKNCIHYKCRCNCDGGWNCPGKKARRVCNPDGSPLREETVTTAQPPPARCRRCVVSDEEKFPPNQPFTLRRGCNIYHCDCQCDGSWNCPPRRARNVCRRREDPRLRAQTCASCRVSSYTYPGRSSFLLTRGCLQYTCQCDCRGHWSCDHRLATNICPDGRPRSPPTSSAQETALSGLSSASSDHGPQDRYRSLVSDVRPHVFTTAKGSSVSAANLGSSQARGQVAAPCRPCRVKGREHLPNTDFVLDRKCKRFHCHCGCNGRWRCPRNQIEVLCDDGSNKEGSSRRSSVGIKPQRPAAAEGQRYGRADVRVVGADSASPSSSLFSSQTSEGQQGPETINVRGYYVSAMRHPSSADDSQAGQRPYGQVDNRRVIQGASSPAENEQHGPQSSRERDGHPASGASSVVEGARTGSEAGGVCSPCQVDDKQYSTGAHFDWRRGCVVYKCTCLCSGSYRCRLSVDPGCREEGAPRAGGIPTGPAQAGTPASQPGGACGNCYVQGLVYPGNMSFTLRQGCKELSCHCRCDGNHECAEPKPIPGCVAMSTPLGGAVYPYGAASSVYPLGGGGYGVRPGRVVNTFQQTIYGSCPSCGQGRDGPFFHPALLAPQPSSGQTPGQGQGAQQPPGQHRYPLAAQAVPRSEGPVPGGVMQPAAGHLDHSSSRYPASPQYRVNPQYPVNAQTPVLNPQHSGKAQPLQQPQAGPARVHGRTTVQHIAMQPVDLAGGNVGDSKVNHRCAICFVNGQSQQGNFQYIKDCSHVTCHCDCSGRLHCSVQQAQGEDCSAQSRPPFPGSQCVSCLVQSQPHPPERQFALRLGCYGYDCTCGCDGLWMCPKQQPRNYCVQPDGTPEGVMNDRHDVSAVEDRQVPLQPRHVHTGGKAGLEDAVYSQSAPGESSLLSCQDCEVRGTTYPSRTRFLLREGCFQHTCDCACDGSWACAKNLTVNVCKSLRGCNPCVWGNDTYESGSSFSYTEGCWQFECRCGCDGEVTCPPALAKDLCRAGDSQALRQRLREQDDQPPLPLDCKPCLVDGQLIRSRTAFSRKAGCWEWLCQCECNGTWSCPPDRSINTCQLHDLHPPPANHPRPRRKGCTVGRKTYYTRLFAFRDGCVQHMCICYDSGVWRCQRGRERRLC